MAWLRDIAALWNAEGVTRETRAVLVAAIYDEIVVRGYEVERVRLTPATLAHGIALALPERVSVWHWRARRASGAQQQPSA